VHLERDVAAAEITDVDHHLRATTEHELLHFGSVDYPSGMRE
jgi:hypothetical protein